MAVLHLPLIENDTPFPSVETALSEPDGLLAFGGDLSIQRLIAAYRSGIFPWFSDGEPILWWSPSSRAIISPRTFHISKSLKKTLKKNLFTFSINTSFERIIESCSSTPRYYDNQEAAGTWITDDMIDAYINLHQAGYAHSVEVWQDNKLVGGLYGVMTDSVFCGESMFHTVTDASKAAMAVLTKLLAPYSHAFIDCQMPTDHLTSLGALTISREEFITSMNSANHTPVPNTLWTPRSFSFCQA
ncbi:leucyl/phenylalanyl-tRNA--protein transferase [Alteromonas sp. 5E99-2]|uniref:leucyl/phenylalanyl-tRNA--protein transferase n=1 Tax=Alteromonas sp. 5E99-2 TaxID=2817683 RepID=UPI001A992B41|nr:leucyl/phenylalanyl-tRNA--protein transferase [Alteromonas sp. 5E99-2]MBO1256232.1 leucyl/phenylalanyl-tRNA--protein transferase [Alteromonas sp. 5E99-2]